MNTKKKLQILCVALGSGLLGFSADQLHTKTGALLFAVGIILLGISIYLLSK